MSKKGLLLLFLLGLMLWGRGVEADGLMARPTHVAGEVLVKLETGLDRAAADSFAQAYQAQVVQEFRLIGAYRLQLSAGISAAQTVADLQKDSRVVYAGLNHYYYIDTPATMPNDSQFGDMWGLNNTGQTGGTPDADIDAPEAWDVETGSADLVVAVIDSGMDLAHPDLAANLWTNPGEIANNGVDDDNNGYIDDLHGWDFVNNDNDPSPGSFWCLGHGTHTAGTVGAVGNNNLGVTGVAWELQLMPIKAFEAIGIFCAANEADLLAAIEYQTIMNVRISNNSWGGGPADPLMEDAIRATRGVFVAAAGNSANNHDDEPGYPADYPLDNIISVAATGDMDELAGFSDYGPTTVDLAAPGVGILSTLPNGNYGQLLGTSMAAPHVAGAAALLMAQDPSVTNNKIKWCILQGADDKDLPLITEGRLNALGALQECAEAQALEILLMPLGPTELSPGDEVSFHLMVMNMTPNPVAGTLKLYIEFALGNSRTLYSGNHTISGDQMFMRDIAFNLPPTIPVGTTFSIFASAGSADSFDEQAIHYIIIP